MSTKPSTRPVRIFISYSHQDTEHKEELWKHLNRFMGGKGQLWGDQMIGAGQFWEQEVWVKLHQADLILFLMSSDAIDSDFIWNVELKKTYKRVDDNEASFIPIYLRDCKWQELKDITRFQVIPRNNKPIIHKSIWGSVDEPFKLVADEIINSIKAIWQRINNEIIEQNRTMRFAGVAQFLKDNPHFFEMRNVLNYTPQHQTEDVLYFIAVKQYLSQIREQFRLAERNGLQWVEESLEELQNFRDICSQMETVWRCSDYIWAKTSQLHEQILIKIDEIERSIGPLTGADFSKIDTYKSKYALPFCFILDKYTQILEELAEESLSAQSQ